MNISDSWSGTNGTTRLTMNHIYVNNFARFDQSQTSMEYHTNRQFV